MLIRKRKTTDQYSTVAAIISSLYATSLNRCMHARLALDADLFFQFFL